MSGIAMRSMRAFVILALAFAVTGCSRVFSSNCNKPAAYANAQSLPPLQIPAGLDAPDRRGVLKIPELSAPDAPRNKGDPCLDEPPRYSSTANLGKGAAIAPGQAAAARKRHWWNRK